MSATSVQFTVAAHIMAALGYFHGKEIFVGGQRSGADGICATRIVPNFPICIALNQSNLEPAITSVQFENICI